MDTLKSFLRSFTTYQKTYLAVVFALTLLFVIFLPELMLDDTSNMIVMICSVISTLANPLCEIMISKQSKFNFAVDMFLIEIPSLIICLWNGWYAIAIVTVAFWMPIDIISWISWGRNRDREEKHVTVVKTLTLKQDLFVIAGIFAFAFVVGTLISRIPGASDSYLDALSAAFGMANGILLAMRYREQWYAWFMTLALYAVLYIRGGSYILLISVAAMFVNTCYGYWKWYGYNKTHNEAGERISA